MKKQSVSLLVMGLLYFFLSCLFRWKDFTNGTPSSIGWELFRLIGETGLFLGFFQLISLFVPSLNASNTPPGTIKPQK